MTNDDGPPSRESSPYILPFVRTLEAAGHTVSVILPDTQRSWIGKAHIVGQDVRTTPYWPPSTTPETHDATATTPSANTTTTTTNDPTPPPHPWILVNSTPASCAQLGLSAHFFAATRGPIDLVISGPNYGRNTTAVFALSSGTLGAALEAAVCGHRAIALSFAFFDRANAAEVVEESCRQGWRVCEWLARRGDGSGEGDGEVGWGQGRLYSVNVPLVKGCLGARTVWTRMLQNEWRQGACFQEVRAEAGAGAVGDAETEEARLRGQEGGKAEAGGSGGRSGAGGMGAAAATPAAGGKEMWPQRHFKWAPRFTDVYESVLRAGPGSDGWAVKEGETSITAIKANYMHAGPFEGEVKL